MTIKEAVTIKEKVSSRMVDIGIVLQITQFLGHEALLLDENRLDEWFDLLDEELVYEVPMRLVKLRDAAGEYPAGFFRVRDTKAMIRQRIERLTTGHAYAEDPASRTVHLVGSVLVEATDAADLFSVQSAVLVYRQRAQDKEWDLIPARRRDLVRRSAEGWRLAARSILLAETILGTPNLGIFL